MKKYAGICIALVCLFSACSTGQKMLKNDVENNAMAMIFFDYEKNELLRADIATRKIQKRMEIPFRVNGFYAKWFYFNNRVYFLYRTHLYEIDIDAEEIKEIYKPAKSYDNFYIADNIAYLQKNLPHDNVEFLKYNMITHEEELIRMEETWIYKFIVISPGNEILIHGSNKGSRSLFLYDITTGLRSDIDYDIVRLHSLAGDTVLYSVYTSSGNIFSLEPSRELRTYNLITKERKKPPYKLKKRAYDYYLFSEDKFILSQTHLPYADILSDFIRIRLYYYAANVDEKTKIKFYSTKNEIDIIGIEKRIAGRP
jgi:hypothetical protein